LKTIGSAKRIIKKQENEFNLDVSDRFGFEEFGLKLEVCFPKDDFSYAVACLRFLNTRSANKDANLVSCGGNGWLRFWNVRNAELSAEFEAHSKGKHLV
jgi:hypothetical protein